MEQLLQSDIDQFSKYIVNFLLILIRAGVFVSLLPVFNTRQLPPQFKIGFAVFISMLLTPVVNYQIVENSLPMIIVREMFLGMVLGLTVRAIFLAVNMAGSFISQTVGMAMATMFNPEIGQSTQLAEAFGVIAMLYFLVMDAHHDLIYIFVKSFEMIPVGNVNIMAVVPKMLSLGGSLFAMGLKLAAPVVTGTLITYLLSGFLYKAAPQMNIFFIVMPLNIFLGFLMIILTIPVFEHVFGIQVSDMRGELTRILAMAKG